jgi:hypothetical protein
MSSSIPPSSSSSHQLPLSESASRESINGFYKEIIAELPIGGNDSINRIKAVYNIVKRKIPDYKYVDLDTLFEMKSKGMAYTPPYQTLREKIYDFCQEAIKNSRASDEMKNDSPGDQPE